MVMIVGFWICLVSQCTKKCNDDSNGYDVVKIPLPQNAIKMIRQWFMLALWSLREFMYEIVASAGRTAVKF